jgi:hypothetical protein
MRRIDTLVNDVKKLYKKEFPTKKYIVSRTNSSVKYSEIFNMKNKQIPICKYHISNIEIVESNIPHFVSLSNKGIFQPHRPANMCISDRTGIFKITLSTGEIGYLVKWEFGFGKNTGVESFYLSDISFLNKLFTLLFYEFEQQAKPKIGIYQTVTTIDGFDYSEYQPTANLVIHDNAKLIYDELALHFSRLPQRKFHDRTLLLYSIPGTGKTELLNQIALKYKDTHCVVFADNVANMLGHQKLAAKYSIPTIVFLEEAEEELAKYNIGGDMARVNSSVKNSLSGVHTPKNKAGCFKIFTTNYPERIDSTILQRKQRIDKVLEFGPLKGATAIDCVKHYLGPRKYSKVFKSLPLTDQHIMFDNMTGVEIKCMCEDLLIESAAQEYELTSTAFVEYKSKRLDEIKKMYDFVDKSIQQGKYRNSPLRDRARKVKVGFNSAAPIEEW